MRLAITLILALGQRLTAAAKLLLTSELGALTLAEGAKLSNDVLVRGVFESVLNSSDVALRLPFAEMTGNALTYNRENTAPTVAWRAVGDVWTEDAPTFTQISKQLCILGGDADVDRYIALSRRNVQDIDAVVLSLKAKALARELDDSTINGTGAGNEPEGIDTILAAAPASQSISMGANGATLTLAKLDELIDAVRGGGPDALVMSRRTRRTANNLWRTSNSAIETRPEFGRFVQFYNGIPILINDYISDAKTVGTSNDCSTIYALTFGEDRAGFEARYNGGEAGDIIQVEDIGNLETKDAKRWRVKSYMMFVLYNTLTCARLTGVRP